MNKINDIKYTELSKAKIQEKRNLVISSTSKGGFTLAQQLEFNEEGRRTAVFLKGAFIIDSVDGLLELRDALNSAIQKSVLKNDCDDDNEEW